MRRKFLIGKANHNISCDQKRPVDRDSRLQLSVGLEESCWSGKRITTLAGIKRDLLIGKADHNFSWDYKKVVDRESRSQLWLGSKESC